MSHIAVVTINDMVMIKNMIITYYYHYKFTINNYYIVINFTENGFVDWIMSYHTSGAQGLNDQLGRQRGRKKVRQNVLCVGMSVRIRVVLWEC